MLDDKKVIKQRDRHDALTAAKSIYKQAKYKPILIDTDHDDREIKSIIVAGMGGSALAADLAKILLSETLTIPMEVLKSYDLPSYAQKNTLVIVSSHSGNTEETLSCLKTALNRGCEIASISTGGKLVDISKKKHIMTSIIPRDTQPRMATIYSLRSILSILEQFNLIDTSLSDEITNLSKWLHDESKMWESDIPTAHNYAKQIALQSVGKTPIFYAGSLMSPVAYKWKISWNENAKNIAFCNTLPEFNHNEFIGWSSHPIEKPFAVFDLVSELENPRILKRFSLSDKLLSGKRPKSTIIPIQGETLVAQMLWASILADFASIYTGILNNVDPTKVDLIEKFKKELG